MFGLNSPHILGHFDSGMVLKIFKDPSVDHWNDDHPFIQDIRADIPAMIFELFCQHGTIQLPTEVPVAR
jgi:hypothetical protein